LTLINPILLPSPGRYKMTVNTFINCPNPLCETGSDLIQIKMKEDGMIDYEKVLLKIGTETDRFRDRY
jgi:hypothetical protein